MSRAKLLLIEDEVIDAMIMERELKRRGIDADFEHVGSAEEAIRMLDPVGGKRLDPDLVLLDLNMPGMGGFGFLKACSDDDSIAAIPLIVVTSSDLEEDRRAAEACNVKDFHVKAFDDAGFDQLAMSVREQLAPTVP